ncbi:MAG: carboxypeptidase regulatory-like domain-containing protein [Bacteroidota bacterium]
MPRYARLLAALVFAVLTVFPAWAQSETDLQRRALYQGLDQLGMPLPHQQAAAFRSTSATPGSISGVLTVEGDSAAMGLPAIIALETTIGLTYEGFFLDDGTYLIADVEPGDYLIIAFYDDSFPTFFPGVVSSDAAEFVPVGEGEAVIGVDFQMAGRGSGVVGNITGRVAGDDGSTPTRGQVIVTSASNPFFFSSTGIRSDGTYMLSGLPSGDYITQAQVQGYLPQYFDGASTREAATPVPVAENVTTENVNFSLSLGGVISGRVTDDAGQPLTDVELFAFANEVPGDDSLGFVYANASTDADGRYTFTGLSEDTYRIFAVYSLDGFVFNTWYDSASSFSDATPVTPIIGTPQTNIDLTIDLPDGYGSVSGVARFSDGSAVTRGAVHLTSPSSNDLFGGTVARTFVRSDGTYRFDRIPEGTYIVSVVAARENARLIQWYDGATTAEDATPIDVVAGVETSGIDFSVSSGATISGTVRNQRNEPLTDVLVIAHKEETARTDTPMLSYASTGPDGTYRFIGLEEGANYRIQATVWTPFFAKELWYDNANSRDTATPVVATEAGVTDVNLVFDDPNTFGQITGTVTYANGDPAPNVAVGLAPLNSLGTADSLGLTINYFVFTGADGAYEMPDVPVGAYALFAQLETNFVYELIWYDGAQGLADATPVQVAEDQVTEGINIVLPVVNGTLSGTVADRNAMPIAKASISVQPADGQGRGFYYGRAETDSLGAFSLDGLPDGDYYVNAFGCSGWRCDTQWWPNAVQREDAEPISIRDGVASVAPAFVLDIANGTSSVSGVITNQATGAPLANAYVTLTSEEGNADLGLAIAAYTTTDSLGAYRIDHLPAGTYQAFAAYWNERATDQLWYDGARTLEDATPISLADDTNISGIDFALDVRPRYGTLSGLVLNGDTGQPFTRAFVEVTPLDAEASASPRSLFAPVYNQFAMTDAQGSFEIDWLFEGEYLVTVYTDEGFAYYGDTQQIAEADQVTIVGGERAAIEVAVARAAAGDGAIEGRVNGGWDAAIVMAIPTSDPNGTRYATLTADGGSYTLNGLPDGAYFVMAFMPYSIMQYYDGVYDPAEATPVEIVGGVAATGIDFNLDWITLFGGDATGRTPTTGGTQVYGSVTDADGNALADASVFAVDDDGTVLASARVHANGSYTLEGVPAGGAYRFKASAVGYESRFHDGTTTHDEAAPVEAGNGQMEIAFTLNTAGQAVNVDEEDTLPTTITLEGNYPNPFNPQTQIVFSLPEAMPVRVTVYNALGQELQTLFDGTLPSGRQRLTWDASSNGAQLPSGMYLYRLEGAGQVFTGSMLLLR